MKRQVSMEEISDGKLYSLNDMVKADCHDCQGCSDCCRGMGESIILDPLDVSRLTASLDTTFEELLTGPLELHVVDGIILPNFKMTKDTECCAFLGADGRCSIHPHRPGICRLFPLGRYYENRGFQYFLQIHECKNTSKTKIKVRKWIDTPDVKRYEDFITSWHYFLEDLEKVVETAKDDDLTKTLALYVLQNFYRIPFSREEDFYTQFQKRLDEAEDFVKRVCGQVME